MESINHIGFIVSAYAAAFIVIASLIAWVTLDYRAQRRILAALEIRGVTRRSGAMRPEQTMAKEKA
jgi:heme exporter protein D